MSKWYAELAAYKTMSDAPYTKVVTNVAASPRAYKRRPGTAMSLPEVFTAL